jgi:hypothetical protein
VDTGQALAAFAVCRIEREEEPLAIAPIHPKASSPWRWLQRRQAGDANFNAWPH